MGQIRENLLQVDLKVEADVKEQENIKKRKKKHVVANIDIKERVTVVEKRNIHASIK